MAGERQADPEVLQALQEVQQALRQEQLALGSLPREHAELSARLEQLQLEREQLHRELEALRQGRPSHFPRLLETLTPPFEVRSLTHTWRRLLRDLMPAVMLASYLLFLPMNTRTRLYAGLILLGALVLGGAVLASWRRRPKWRFGEQALSAPSGAPAARLVPYAKVLGVEARISPSQHKRGVGDVVVKCAPASWELAERTLTLKNVPEPERLARWLRDVCGRKE
jgi:hypothetical protein